MIVSQIVFKRSNSQTHICVYWIPKACTQVNATEIQQYRKLFQNKTIYEFPKYFPNLPLFTNKKSYAKLVVANMWDLNTLFSERQRA